MAKVRADSLQSFLSRALARTVEVNIAPSYDALTKDVLAGRSDAGWAPPFVCARVEAMAARAIARGVRKGSSSYRAALVCAKKSAVTFDKLQGTSAAWTDQDSVAGYLLPMALLKSKKLDAAKLFFAQTFAGSYRAALEQVLNGKADVTSVFAAPASARDAAPTGADEILLGSSEELRVLAYTDESPNDGVVVSPNADPAAVSALEKTLLTLQTGSEGLELLRNIFTVDRFEAAPKMGYRALYRVAMASL